jgi:hypothetical protein
MKIKSLLIVVAMLCMTVPPSFAKAPKADEIAAQAYASGYKQGQLDMKDQAQGMVDNVVRACQDQIVEMKRQFEEQNQRANLLQMQKTDLEIQIKKLKAQK